LLFERARVALATATLVAALGVFLWRMHGHYPIDAWLFWKYAAAWLKVGLFSSAALCAGRAVSARIPLPALSLAEKLLFCFALGVLVFYLGMFIAGMLGWYGPLLFFVWPTLLVGAGFRYVRRDIQRLGAHKALRIELARLLPQGIWELLALLLLLVGCVGVYLQVLTPENVGYDARWYHLPLAEEYARAGGFHRFADGWYLSAYPQLASTLYAWGFCAPGAGTFEGVTSASHIEFVLFLSTLSGVTLLVRRLLKQPRLRFAGAAVFLYPGVVVYDSNLITGADHVLAFWGPPIALAAIFALRTPDIRQHMLLACMVAGAALTKYQALYLLAPLTLALLTRAMSARRFVPLLVFGGVALVLTAPHWLKNLLYYGDPLYPLLNAYFTPEPFHDGAGELFRRIYSMPEFTPQGSLGRRLLEALDGTLSFAFMPRDIWSFHRDIPVFGTLFTLLVVPLAFTRRSVRIWLLVGAGHLGTFVWFFTNHQERFLQALVPWFAAASAATLVRLWQLGPAVRIATGALLSASIIWSGDHFFLRRHRMINGPILNALSDHLSDGFEGERDSRFHKWTEWWHAQDKLPGDATVLIHNERTVVGLRRAFLNDDVGYQGATEYLDLVQPGKARAHLQQLGATHVLLNRDSWPTMDLERIGREVVFYTMVERETEPVWQKGKLELRRLLDTPTPGSSRQEPNVAVIGCKAKLPRGVFSISGLRLNHQRARIPKSVSRRPDRALRNVDAVFLQKDCRVSRALLKKRPSTFTSVAHFSNGDLWLRLEKREK
jgi:hypothetical protein